MVRPGPVSGKDDRGARYGLALLGSTNLRLPCTNKLHINTPISGDNVALRLSARPRLSSILALPFLSTGGALVFYIVSGVSLPLAILGVVALTGSIGALVVVRLPLAARAAVRRRVVRGAAAGLLATAAYDGCRLAVVSVFDLTFWPFDVFTRFGRLLIGDSVPSALTATVGTAFHYANGVGFGVAYVLFVRRPGVVTGLAWAAVLETAMVSLYPGWLGLRALDEFLSVSIAGHVAYGLVLGWSARALLHADPAVRGQDARVPS